MTNIEFDNIPTSIRRPGVYSEYNSKGAVSTLPANKQEVLIIAPMTIKTEGDFTVPVRVYSDIDAAEAFGYGSWAHLMTRMAIRNNPLINLSVMGLKDHSAGVAATASITLNGTATGQGVMTANIANQDYKIAVAKGENATNLAIRLGAVINGVLDAPVTASVEGTTITLTAKCKGNIGNEIAIGVKNTVPDMQLNCLAFSGGAENASIQATLATVAGADYQVIICPFSDVKNAKALSEHLKAVSSPVEKRPAIGVLAWRGTMATGATFTGQLNDERLTVGWYKGATDSCALIAAAYGAVIAKEEDPARPLNTLRLMGLAEVSPTQTPLFAECNQALYNGLTPLTVVNHHVQIMRAVSTYTKSATNTDDPAYLDLTTIRTLDYVRKAVEQRIELRFPRAKLSNRTPPKVQSEILDVLLRLEELEIVENVAANKGKLVVQRNPQDPNRLDTVIPSDVVNGLHVVANRIDLIL